MRRYVGTKTLLAKPMTRKEYCDYRGWQVPPSEDPRDKVYLVEYPVEYDTKPNHENHEGYISMSPKTVFEKYYKEIGDVNLTKGHRYELANFEVFTQPGQTLQFIHKEMRHGELVTVQDGTTNEEVLEVLIDRMQFLQNKFPCKENAIVITNLEESLMWLNKRTADRSKRGVEGKHEK